MPSSSTGIAKLPLFLPTRHDWDYKPFDDVSGLVEVIAGKSLYDTNENAFSIRCG